MTDYLIIARAALMDLPEDMQASMNKTQLSDLSKARQSARDFLNASGVRLMELDGGSAIGVWSDLDELEIRAALRTLEMDRLPIRLLDGDDLPSS